MWACLRTNEDKGESFSIRQGSTASEPALEPGGAEQLSVQDPSGSDVDGLSLMDVPQLALGLSSVTERAFVGNTNLKTLFYCSVQ